MSGFGLYVHWPFCLSKCPYCDFNSHVRDGIDDARWRRAYLKELARAFAEAGPRRLDSIFFGGGTPSLMEPETVAAIIAAATDQWPAADDIEITLEANPTSVEAARLEGFKAAGVNRVSLGVQALDDAALGFLGREHGAAEALAAVETAAGLFARYSFDLIYARPDQTPADWEEELTRALGFAGGHLSVYQLTIEPGTAFFGRHERGETLTAPDDRATELYDVTQAILGAAGLPAYEISNHARPGEAARHNLIYWQGGDYAAVGPGAHARLCDGAGRRAIRRTRLPEKWLETVEAEGHASDEDTFLSPEAWLEESLMMGLRLADGIDIAALERRHGRPLETLIDRGRLDRLVEAGFLTEESGTLKATSAGRLRLNAVLAHLLA